MITSDECTFFNSICHCFVLLFFECFFSFVYCHLLGCLNAGVFCSWTWVKYSKYARNLLLFETVNRLINHERSVGDMKFFNQQNQHIQWLTKRLLDIFHKRLYKYEGRFGSKTIFHFDRFHLLWKFSVLQECVFFSLFTARLRGYCKDYVNFFKLFHEIQHNCLYECMDFYWFLLEYRSHLFESNAMGISCATEHLFLKRTKQQHLA